MINRPDAPDSQIYLEGNSTCFGQFLCPSSRVFHCTHSNGIVIQVFLTACIQDHDFSDFLEGNSTCIGQFLCPSSGVFNRTHSNGICHTVLLTACEQDPYFSDLFWKEILRVSDSSSVHHQEFFTAHTAMVYVIQVC